MKGVWCVYVLRCSDGSLYTGSTNNVKSRLEKHLQGTASKYTRSRLPVTLVYTEACEGKTKALGMERTLKKMSRKEKIAYIQKPWTKEQ